MAQQNGLIDTWDHEITYMGYVSWVFVNIPLDSLRQFFDLDPPIRPLAPDLLTEVTVTDYDAQLVHVIVKPVSRMAGGWGGRPAKYFESMRRKRAGAALIRARAIDWLSGIREMFDGPILISAQPEHVVPADDDITDAGSGEAELGGEAIGLVLAESGFHYVAQPIETVLNGTYTRRDYAVGSVALGERRDHRNEDKLYMNERYGALVVNRALRLLTDLDAAGNCGTRAV